MRRPESAIDSGLFSTDYERSTKGHNSMQNGRWKFRYERTMDESNERWGQATPASKNRSPGTSIRLKYAYVQDGTCISVSWVWFRCWLPFGGTRKYVGELAGQGFFCCFWRWRGGWQDGWAFAAQGLEGAVDEGAHVPAVDVFKGGFAGGVVAAGQDAGLEVYAVVLEGFDDLQRVLAGEGEVVVGVDQEDFFVLAG
jgi:hypothetical protein